MGWDGLRRNGIGFRSDGMDCGGSSKCKIFNIAHRTAGPHWKTWTKRLQNYPPPCPLRFFSTQSAPLLSTGIRCKKDTFFVYLRARRQKPHIGKIKTIIIAALTKSITTTMTILTLTITITITKKKWVPILANFSVRVESFRVGAQPPVQRITF